MQDRNSWEIYFLRADGVPILGICATADKREERYLLNTILDIIDMAKCYSGRPISPTNSEKSLIPLKAGITIITTRLIFPSKEFENKFYIALKGMI